MSAPALEHPRSRTWADFVPLWVGVAATIAAGCHRSRGAPQASKSDAATGTLEHNAGNQDVQEVGAAAVLAPTPAVTINVGERQALFHVQIAATPEERANGLVGRPTLASDAGLLLVFDKPGIQEVGMKTTLLPIDMIFIGADRHVVGIIERAKPRSTTKHRGPIGSQYVLEISGGLASRLGVQVGQSVDFRAIPGT
jgi:uncharacterized membrane protein (UPF0127 family)